jgi:hypothetical protein
MASEPVSITGEPGQNEIWCEDIRFRLAKVPEDVPPLCWYVYGGENGEVIVYKPDVGSWERLDPTRKDNGYLFVSIRKQCGQRWACWQPYVHQVILYAFVGPPTIAGSVAKHLSDDPDDNRPCNLSWGTKSENAVEAHRHRRLGTAPSTRSVRVPIRREVCDQLRRIGPSKGKPFEDFIEGILSEYIRSHCGKSYLE